MRIRSSTSYPHPILAPDTGDYADRAIQLELSAQEDPAAGQAILSGSFSIDDPAILDLLAKGQAVAGAMVTCRDTYLDEFIAVSPGVFSIDLSGGRVRGAVQVRGVVIATQDDVELASDRISSEFPPEARKVGVGDLVAYSEELRFEAGLEKLAPLESIFRLRLHDEVAEGVFVLDLEGEAIEILAAAKLHTFLSLLREQPMRDTLLSSLFLPVVMAVLDAMRAEGAYAEKRWHIVMSARCNAENIDVKHADLAEAAQTLLDSPLGSLQKVFERASS
jgi:hypothetical protein